MKIMLIIIAILINTGPFGWALKRGTSSFTVRSMFVKEKTMHRDKASSNTRDSLLAELERVLNVAGNSGFLSSRVCKTISREVASKLPLGD